MNPLRMTWVLTGCLLAYFASPPDFRYTRVGNSANASLAVPKAGFALMGGGDDLDDAFRWLCDRAGGGDFLILRAHGDDEYNPYVQRLCRLNSVATLIIPNRAAATDPQVAQIIAHAGALFIAGGDQANYINFWMNTPVQAALNDAIGRGVPIGGTSAGLAVMGEWSYSAQADKPGDPNLDSKTVLHDASHPRITLVHGFLNIPILRGVITDSHFAKRDRMGRLLVFISRLNEPGGKPEPSPSKPAVHGMGIDEGAAVLLDPDGPATVIGRRSGAYFIDPIDNAFFADVHHPSLSLPGVTVQKIAPGHTFNLKTWTGDATSYSLSAKDGKLRSMQAAGAIY